MDNTHWLLFSFTLPAKNQAGRMRVWRRLGGLGAVIVKSALYALPLRDDLREQLAWLAKEVEGMGGEALLLETGPPANLSGRELAALFTTARDADWQEIEKDIQALLEVARRSGAPSPDAAKARGRKTAQMPESGDIPPAGQADSRASLAQQGRKLARRVEALAAIDYFPSGRGGRSRELLAGLEALASGEAASSTAIPRRDPADFTGMTWVTRETPYIDRLASFWLVRRFVDPGAALAFVPAGEDPSAGPGRVRFDMDQAEFTHVGPLTTFEVLCESFGLGAAVPDRLRALIRAIDVKEVESGPAEAAGVALVLDGLCALSKNDEDRVERAMALFDALLEICKQGE